MESISTVSLRDVIETYGAEAVNAMLAHDRHRIDEEGEIYWISAELAELSELIDVERQRERLSGNSRCPSDPTVPVARHELDPNEISELVERGVETSASSGCET